MRCIAIAITLTGLLAGGVADARDTEADPARQPTAGSHGSTTARRGKAPTISPNDPAYAENGAPRRGQPSGYDTAGAPSPNGNYAPIQHQRTRRW